VWLKEKPIEKSHGNHPKYDGNNRQNEEPTVDPITMTLAMNKELENMKQ